MTEHCRECGSRICGHANCPQCNPCRHCDGGDRFDKYFGESESDPDWGSYHGALGRPRGCGEFDD